MNSHKTTVIPFPAPSKNGVRYSAKTEKQNVTVKAGSGWTDMGQ